MSIREMRLDRQRLFALFRYDEATGHFYRLTSVANQAAGKIAGSVNADGYVSIIIDRIQYYGHRLAYFYMTGLWPHEVDHKNTVRDDNRWNNLREVSRTQNSWNASMRPDNTSGYKGVSLHKQQQRWRATIRLNGRQKHIGMFDSREDAYAAYCQAARNHFGEFARLK